MEIGSWVFVKVRGKVGPRNEGYAWVPKYKGFVKLQEVENFLTWVISSLTTIRFFLEVVNFSPKFLGLSV